MARDSFKGNKAKRDGHQFIPMPYVVIDSASYRGLGFPAVKLLFDIARQYNGANNGRLVACTKYLQPLGWKSNATIYRALRELLDSNLLFETRKGGWPNKAAWFAVTWMDLGYFEGMDIQRSAFHRGSYLNRPCITLNGVNAGAIAPRNGIRLKPSALLNGVIQ